MNRTLIRSALIAAIILQIMDALELRNGLLPRSPETVAASDAYKANPTEATRATLSALTHQDAERNGQILLITMLLADIAAIYFLWNHGVKKPSPEKAVSDLN